MTRLRGSQIALLALLAVIAYAPVLRTGFLYDDHVLIESNPWIRSWSVTALRHDVTSGVFNTSDSINFYRPLQTLSTRIEYLFFKLNPFPYHLTNLLLHAGNTVLLALLFATLGIDSLSLLLAACLFAVHPIIVEPLLMVSGRGELLGLFFTLSSLILWLQKEAVFRLAGYAAFLLALLSKESTVVTPLLFVLTVYVKKEPLSRYKRLIPMCLLAILYSLWRGHVLGHLLPPLGIKQAALFGVMEFPRVLVSYARILVAPWDLHTDRLLPRLESFWCLYTLGVCGFSAWIFWRGNRWAIFSWLWFVVSFLPKSVLMISGSFMSDHWAYPALPAMALPIAFGLSHLWTSTDSSHRLLARGLFVLVLLGEWSLVILNISQRNTDEKLYRQALQHTTSWTMTYNLGLELLRQNRAQEALPYLETAQNRDPYDLSATRALAYGYWKSGQSRRAVTLLQTLRQRDPADLPTQQLLIAIQRSPTTR